MSSSEEASEALPPGTTLGRYELRRLIGQGGMGCVYEAIHRDLKKRVAIKTLLPMLAANEEARQRFFREGEAASRIRHPHVVDVTDVGAEGSTIYLVMEYLQGEDLSGLIAREQGLAFERAADILLPVMAAITTAHEQGVVHRDLKPENIFLSTSSYGGMVPKVLDFGISKVLDQVQRMALTGTSVTLGTAFYLPPEHLRGSRQADARGDQYALGAILYECMTGHRAFQGETLYAVLKAVGDGAYAPVRQWRPELPAGLEAIITRALSLEPAARFESVRQMGRALLPFASVGLRAMWTPFFLVAPEATLAEPALTPAPINSDIPRAITGGTAQMPVVTDAMSAVGTQPPSRTTLGDATGEPSEDGIAGSAGSRSRIPVLAGLAVVVVVAVIVAAMRRDHRAPQSTRESAQLSPVTAPAVGAPAVAAPPPAAAAPAAATPPAPTEAAASEPALVPAAPPAPDPVAVAPAPEPPPAPIAQRPPTVARPRTSRAAPAPAPANAPARVERSANRGVKGRSEPLPNSAPIVD